jgi:shikimate kinase
MPGSGKSTIGKAASARLGLAYVDVDQEIEQQSGCSVRAFFERHGEQAFRDLETEVLRSLLVGPPCLIATGGGVVLREENRQALRSRALCVYLEASPRLLWSRLRRDRRRPLLQFSDAEQRLRGMSAEREPLYRETAAIVIETDGFSFNGVVDELVARVAAKSSQ